jgi:hypothetical protein
MQLRRRTDRSAGIASQLTLGELPKVIVKLSKKLLVWSVGRDD